MLKSKRQTQVKNNVLERLLNIGSAFGHRLAALTRYRRHIGVMVNVLQILLLGTLLYHNREVLPRLYPLVTPQIIGACLLLYLGSLLLQFTIWLDLMGYRRIEWSRALDDYIRTNFMGRLPGGVWKIVGRMTVYRGPRLPARAILAINLVEIFLMLLSSGVVILLSSAISWQLRIAGLGSLVLVLLLLALSVSRTQPALRSVHQPTRWVIWTAGYCFSWICGGLITYLVIAPFDAVTTFADGLRYWCIAGATGVLLQAIPLNVLIRDATLVALLQPFMPLANAIIAALAVRLVMLVCDLAIGWTLLGVVSRINQIPDHSQIYP
jgi:hypothetical protein